MSQRRDKAFYEEAAQAENAWVRAVVLNRDHALHARSEKIVREAERMALEALGSNHAAYGVAVLNHALYHFTVTNDQLQAQNALARSRQILAETPLELADGLYWLGVSYYDAGEVRKAENAWTEVVDIRRRNQGDARALAETLVALSCCYVETELKRAAPLLAEALKLQRHSLGATHETVLDTETRLAHVLRAASKNERT
jgi:tetratricopeptide (TPR) repeat protein